MEIMFQYKINHVVNHVFDASGNKGLGCERYSF